MNGFAGFYCHSFAEHCTTFLATKQDRPMLPCLSGPIIEGLPQWECLIVNCESVPSYMTFSEKLYPPCVNS